MNMHMYAHAQNPTAELARPDKIVVATDLSDSDILLPHAIAQAQACGAHLTLVHALMGAGVPALDIGGFAQLEQNVNEKMKQMVAIVKAQGISCSSVITHTFCAEDTLPEAARWFGAKRLIMATHGRGRVGQIMLGSIAHELLSILDIPIFAVGPKASAYPEHCTPAKILHPVSFSEGYQDRVEFARNIAQVYGAQLMLMHVIDPDVATEFGPNMRTMEFAKHALDNAIPDRTTLTFPLLTHVAFGNVVDEILNTANVSRADWIVLGTRPIATKPISYAPLVATSRAYKLMAAANIPVLTLPHRVRVDAEKLEENEIPVALR
jgi:nucleotide-binding universal stress UspA family protein